MCRAGVEGGEGPSLACSTAPTPLMMTMMLLLLRKTRYATKVWYPLKPHHSIYQVGELVVDTPRRARHIHLLDTGLPVSITSS